MSPGVTLTTERDQLRRPTRQRLPLCPGDEHSGAADGQVSSAVSVSQGSRACKRGAWTSSTRLPLLVQAGGRQRNFLSACLSPANPRPARGHEWQAGVNNRANGSACPACAAVDQASRLRVLARVQRCVAGERSLAANPPGLLVELDPSRNRDLDPAAVGAASKRKVWWRCAECAHVWQATVSSRALRGTGCPACFCERRARRLAELNRVLAQLNARVSAERSLAVKHPELIAELHGTRNGELDPYTIGAGSHRRLWWQCPRGHEWQTTINTRSRGCWSASELAIDFGHWRAAAAAASAIATFRNQTNTSVSGSVLLLLGSRRRGAHYSRFGREPEWPGAWTGLRLERAVRRALWGGRAQHEQGGVLEEQLRPRPGRLHQFSARVLL